MDKSDKQSYEAIKLATLFLTICEDRGIDSNIAQAAFGNAWYRLCCGMKIKPENFKEMAQAMVGHYKDDYENG